GKDEGGTVFKLLPNGKQSKLTVLYTFCAEAGCTDGWFPAESLVLDPSGVLFGTTQRGGLGQDDQEGLGGGTLFRLNGIEHTVLHNFCSEGGFACSDGSYPHGILIDKQGN